jgi:ubiquinone/menaquinone biosynthesis C-methylase UbiE
MSDAEIKQQVQKFYDRVGWQQVSAGTYQNATYEDLRPVAHEYVHRCHLRVTRHLAPAGDRLLDAGSGPIQYPEYVEYSRGYRHRVCLDISSVALQEARQRIGEHGLFVVGDIANLPFKADVFDGLVSLHTIHHLPADEHARAYLELHRVLAPGQSGVVVNGWDLPPLTQLQNFLIRLADLLRRKPKSPLSDRGEAGVDSSPLSCRGGVGGETRGTFVRKHTPAWLKKEVGRHIPVEMWCWRSLSVRFMRTFIHQRLGGKFLLRLLFWLEERFPHFFGRNGQYPLIVLRKKPV